jgi:hypothetical protein
MKMGRIGLRQGWFLGAALLAALAGPAHAQISAVEGPIPFDADNPMFGPADAQGANVGVNLKTFGYVEEEYFVTGQAAAYEHSADGPQARTEKLPYTTRIVIRRPADPSDFSGVVHFEPAHPTHGWNGHWLVLNHYPMSRGDIYVFANVGDASKGWSGSPQYDPPASPTGANVILKWFNPDRYAALSWPEEEGIRYQMMADIGRKLRSEDADNPLKDLDVRGMLVGGWSYTGSIQRTFINEGFHDQMRLPDGGPIFDGYLIGVSSELNEPGYLPLYNDEPFVPVDSPRRRPRAIDAHVIEFLTESEVELADRSVPASAEVIEGRRVYELAGVIHTDNLYGPTLARKEPPIMAQLRNKGYRFATVSTVSTDNCDLPASDIPEDAFVRAAVDNLRHWVVDGTAPPDNAPLELNGTQLARDEVGNAVGGIRAAEFEAPLARYGRYQGTEKPGCRADNLYPSVFLVRDDLTDQELVERYGSPENYLARYDSHVDRLVEERRLLIEDALVLKARVRERVVKGF